MERMDPPPTSKAQRSEEWREKVTFLKAHPNEFYRAGNYSPGVATHIRRGEYKAFLPDDLRAASPEAREAYMSLHWKITTRKTDDGKRNDLFVKWLG
jgi:hypothetical protein